MQTSGKQQTDFPSPALQDSSLLFAKTLFVIRPTSTRRESDNAAAVVICGLGETQRAGTVALASARKRHAEQGGRRCSADLTDTVGGAPYVL